MDSWRPEKDNLVSSPAMVSRARKVAGSCAGSWGSDGGSAAFAALLRPPASTLLKGGRPHPAVGQGPRPVSTAAPGQGLRPASLSGDAHAADTHIASPVASVADAEVAVMAKAAAADSRPGDLSVAEEAHNAGSQMASLATSVADAEAAAMAEAAAADSRPGDPSVSEEAQNADSQMANPSAAAADVNAAAQPEGAASTATAAAPPSDNTGAASSVEATSSAGIVDEAGAPGLASGAQSAADHKHHDGAQRSSDADSGRLAGEAGQSRPSAAGASQPTTVAVPDGSNGIPGMIIRESEPGSNSVSNDTGSNNPHEEGYAPAAEAATSMPAGGPQQEPRAADSPASPSGGSHREASATEAAASQAQRDPLPNATDRDDSSRVATPHYQHQRRSLDSQSATAVHDSCLCRGVALAAASQQSRWPFLPT